MTQCVCVLRRVFVCVCVCVCVGVAPRGDSSVVHVLRAWRRGAQEGDKVAQRPSTAGAAQGADDIIPIPEDIGDGRNDDIVLRQIREAAMNERDPLLRERLWDEYRRISGSR